MHTVLGHGVKVGLIGEATLRHESAIAGRMTDQLICSGKIDGEVSQITVIYSDEARSEEHTSELQSLMRISYAVFCLKKKNKRNKTRITYDTTKTNPHTYRTNTTLYT